MYTGKKVKVQLVGLDGNSFSIMGRVRREMRRQGISEETMKEYSDRATSGDRDNFLSVTLEYVEDVDNDNDTVENDFDDDQ